MPRALPLVLAASLATALLPAPFCGRAPLPGRRGHAIAGQPSAPAPTELEFAIPKPLGLQLEERAEGVFVSLVFEESNAERAGVRRGDRVVATSASVGDAMWEKRSISGVMAAIQTRVDGQVRLRVQRSSSARRRRAWELPLRRSFDVTLSKPLGLALAQRSAANATGEEEERWVEVEAVEAGGSAEASGLVCSGDSVVATSASVGDAMWPHRTLEGVSSAISTRLFTSPSVTLRLVRTMRLGPWAAELVDVAHGKRRGLSPEGRASYRLQRRGAREWLEDRRAAEAVREVCAPAIAKFGRRGRRGGAALDVPPADRAGGASRPAGQAAGGGGAAGSAEGGEGGGPLRDVAAALASEAASGEGGEIAALVALWRRVRLSPLPLDAKMTVLFLSAALRCGAPRLAIAFFHDATSPAEAAVLTRPRRARAPVVPNARIFNTLIKAHGAAGERSEAGAVLQRMLAEGVSPDVFTFTTLMSVAAKAGDRRGMLTYFRAIDEAGLKPTLGSWNVVLDFCARARQPAQAADVLRRMREGGVTPDAISYAAIVQAHVNGGSVDGARAALDEAVESGTRLDAAVFNALLGGYASELRWSDASELVRAMAARGVPPDGVSYGLLLRACLRARQADEAASALDRMLQDGIPASVQAFSMVLSAYAHGGRIDEAIALLRRMQTEGLAPNGYTFSAMMEACVNGGQPETARAVFDQMEEQGIAPDAASYTLLVRAHTSPQTARADHLAEFDIRAAREVLVRMIASGVPPNVATYNALLAGCMLPAEPGGEPRYSYVLEALEHMLRAQVSPTKRTFRLLVQREPPAGRGSRGGAAGRRGGRGGRRGRGRQGAVGGAAAPSLSGARLSYLQSLVRVFRSSRRQLDGEAYLSILAECVREATSSAAAGRAPSALEFGLSLVAERHGHGDGSAPQLFVLRLAHEAEAEPLEAALRRLSAQPHPKAGDPSGVAPADAEPAR